mgnify:CR=1 FL=1
MIQSKLKKIYHRLISNNLDFGSFVAVATDKDYQFMYNYTNQN